MAFDDNTDLNELEAPEAERDAAAGNRQPDLRYCCGEFGSNHAADPGVYYRLWPGVSAICQ